MNSVSNVYVQVVCHWHTISDDIAYLRFRLSTRSRSAVLSAYQFLKETGTGFLGADFLSETRAGGHNSQRIDLKKMTDLQMIDFEKK